MPANLPPQYFETEKKLKSAKTSEEKIVIMEELLSIIPKHKGTEKLQALYKTKIAKLRAQKQKKQATSRGGPSFHIDKAGAGQVVLVGPPNSGKSQLIQSLTNADPEVGDYPFTTHSPYPAMMPFENIQIQLIDMPPVTPDFLEAWQAELIKGADVVLVVLDLDSQDTARDCQMISEKLKEKNIEFVPAGKRIEPGNRLFRKKALIAANKTDRPDADLNLTFLLELTGSEFKTVPVSALRGDGIEELRAIIFGALDVVRVYSKEPRKKADTGDPFIFQKGETLMDMAKTVHKDFARKLRFARIWGRAKYEGQ